MVSTQCPSDGELEGRPAFGLNLKETAGAVSYEYPLKVPIAFWKCIFHGLAINSVGSLTCLRPVPRKRGQSQCSEREGDHLPHRAMCLPAQSFRQPGWGVTHF